MAGSDRNRVRWSVMVRWRWRRLWWALTAPMKSSWRGWDDGRS